jgi:hypothetical protein
LLAWKRGRLSPREELSHVGFVQGLGLGFKICSRFGVQGSGFRVWVLGLGFNVGVWGSGFRVQGLGLRI